MQDIAERERTTLQDRKSKLGKIFVRRKQQMKREKSTFEILLDVLIGATLPLAVAGIWFLTKVEWWV